LIVRSPPSPSSTSLLSPPSWSPSP
jgi:hypothetical protein